jgi:hypothetical protein
MRTLFENLFAQFIRADMRGGEREREGKERGRGVPAGYLSPARNIPLRAGLWRTRVRFPATIV